MKLNNNGWGTGTMILLSSGLLIALLIVAVLISNLYGSFGNSVSNRFYLDMETRLENAAAVYVTSNNIEVNSEMRVGLATLQDSGLIGDFQDRLGHSCDGYVIITRINLSDNFYARISCPDYQTRNYGN